MDERKNPLGNTWCYWHEKKILVSKPPKPGEPPREKEFEVTRSRLCDVRTIEELWSWHNNLPKLPFGDLYHFFRKNVEPTWDDPCLKSGGRLAIRIPKNRTRTLWANTLASLAGETFPLSGGSDYICGATFTTRAKDNLIYVWNANSESVDEEKWTDAIVRDVLGTTRDNLGAIFYKKIE